LREDLSLIQNAVRAGSKIGVGEKPTKEEQSDFDNLKHNYPVFFESDSEEETNIDYYSSPSLPGKIMKLKNYLKKEIKANTSFEAFLERKAARLNSSNKRQKLSQDESSTMGAGPSQQNFGAESVGYTSDKGKQREVPQQSFSQDVSSQYPQQSFPQDVSSQYPQQSLPQQSF
jgi:hypothetical protein